MPDDDDRQGQGDGDDSAPDGGGRADDDRDDDAGGGADVDGGGDGGVGQYAPPSEAEWALVQSALGKAKDESKQHRGELRDLRAELKRFRDEQAAKAREGETAHQAELRTAAEDAAAKVEAFYKPLVVRSAAGAALVAARAAVVDKDGNVVPEKLARILRLVDMAAVEVGEGGRVSGVDDQVAQIKADYPELFESVRPPRPKADAADRKPEPKKPATSAEKLAASLGQ